MRYAQLIENKLEISDLTYFDDQELENSIYQVSQYKENHFRDGWQDIKLENPPQNDSDVTKDELITITNMQEKRTTEDENSIYTSDKMDTFHFREYLNANDLDYSSSEITAIIDDVWKITRTFPSGHSCGARLVAEYLITKHPDHKEQFLEIAERIGVGRIQAGFHYPSDHVSGIDLALKVFPYLEISIQHLNESDI